MNVKRKKLNKIYTYSETKNKRTETMAKETTIDTEYARLKEMRIKYQSMDEVAYKRAVNKNTIYVTHYDYAVSVVDGTITIFYKGRKSSVQQKEYNILYELARRIWAQKKTEQVKNEIKGELVGVLYWYLWIPGIPGDFH